MSPLRIEREGGWDELPDDHRLSLYGWHKATGVGANTVKTAFGRVGVELETGQPQHENSLVPLCAPVGEFPELLRGLQMATSTDPGREFNKWARAVDLTGSVMTGEFPNKRKFEYVRGRKNGL